jgi:hypothetical protein
VCVWVFVEGGGQEEGAGSRASSDKRGEEGPGGEVVRGAYGNDERRRHARSA